MGGFADRKRMGKSGALLQGSGGDIEPVHGNGVADIGEDDDQYNDECLNSAGGQGGHIISALCLNFPIFGTAPVEISTPFGPLTVWTVFATIPPQGGPVDLDFDLP